MFKYLWLKNIKTDSDFKRYQFLKLLLFIILGIAVLTYVFLNTSSPYGEVSRFFRVFWFTVPFLIAIITSILEVYRQVKALKNCMQKELKQRMNVKNKVINRLYHILVLCR